MGGRDRGERPPPETERIIVEKWRYFPEVYTFGEEAESIEKVSEKLFKVNFP